MMLGFLFALLLFYSGYDVVKKTIPLFLFDCSILRRQSIGMKGLLVAWWGLLQATAWMRA
jgi:hypothetical protein